MAGKEGLVGAAPPVEVELEGYRQELIGYCYRMLGSGFEAEDAVQQTLVRAWRGMDAFEGRSSLRSWLYRIATNVCLDMLREPQRRALPMDMGPPSSAESGLGPPLAERVWVQPVPDARALPPEADPAELAAQRDSVRLAFVAALQHLPPRQRAVLILREVLGWRASEVAVLLDTSVVAVNSALQRARATLAGARPETTDPAAMDARQRRLLARYLDAFQNYDVAAMVALLREDAAFSMPPFRLWLRGPDQVASWLVGQGSGCRGSHLVATRANGCPAVAIYHPGKNGYLRPFAIQVLEISADRIAALHNFLFPDLFTYFGLPSNDASPIRVRGAGRHQPAARL